MFEDAKTWFEHLRDRLVEKIQSYESQAFVEKKWSHHEKGGGLMTKTVSYTHLTLPTICSV